MPPPQNINAQPQEQHVIASPNPTIDEKTPASVAPAKADAVKLQPAQGTTAAPLKKAVKPRRKRTKPRTD